MLTERFTHDTLLKMNLPIAAWHPFPTYHERSEWDARLSQKEIWIQAAEAYTDYNWPPITADMYLTLRTTGELKPHWDRFRERRSGLGILTIAECLEGSGRFMHQIINGIISICEETTWIQPLAMSRLGYELPDATDQEVDLTSSETAALLAWIDYLLGDALDAVSKRIRVRIRETIQKRIITPYLNRDDYWWMGFTSDRANNWNPWCNMNVILCVLLTEDNPERRADVLYKVMRSLDRYTEAYAPDGCCDEGPMYWHMAGGGLYICLELLEQASSGLIRVYDDEKLRLIGQYIKKAHIDGEWFVDYADGDAHVGIDSSTYRFGKALGDYGMIGLGAAAAPMKPQVYEWFRTYHHLMDIFTEEERLACAVQPEYPADAWFWHTGMMTAREHEGSPQGFFLSAKAGHNGESHNHNDIGNFIVYYNGEPLFIDLGTEEYCAKTFSPQRFELWYLQSRYHNCPHVNETPQHEGAEYRAEEVRYIRDGEVSGLELELAKSYPNEAGICSWKRSVSLTRGEKPTVDIRDTFSLSETTSDINRILMTPCTPMVNGGVIEFACGGQIIHAVLDEYTTATVEEIPIEDSRLRKNWGGMVYRIVLKEKNACKAGTRSIHICR